MAGLTPTGFQKSTLDEIKTQIEEDLRSTFGIFINLLPSSVFATLVGIFAERLASLWDLQEAIYNSRYPDTALGVSLDNAVSLTGISRLAAAKSTSQGVLLIGTAGTLVPAGTRASVNGNPLAIFETLTNVTLLAGADEVQTATFDFEPDAGAFTIKYGLLETAILPYTQTAATIQEALRLLAGLEDIEVTGDFATGFVFTFAGSGGKRNQPMLVFTAGLTNTGAPVVITMDETVEGEPQASVNMQAIDFGPTDAPVGTLTEVETPVSGLDSFYNPNATVIGRNIETDAEMRLRRQQTLQVAGNATVDAIRSRLLSIAGVRNVFIFENTTLITNMDGLPGKSYEAVVDGGDNQDIGNAVWASKPAGIQTYGNIAVNVVDSQGTGRTVYFSRPDDIEIYFSIDLTINPAAFPEDGQEIARDVIIAWGNQLGIGVDIIVYPQLVAQLNQIPGILDITVRIDTAPVSTTAGAPAVDDNIDIQPSEVAEFAVPRANINLVVL